MSDTRDTREVARRIVETIRRVPMRAKFFWWSLCNWIKGYQFRPVQRFRCCGHTTPYAHAPNCTYNGLFFTKHEHWILSMALQDFIESMREAEADYLTQADEQQADACHIDGDVATALHTKIAEAE